MFLSILSRMSQHHAGSSSFSQPVGKFPIVEISNIKTPELVTVWCLSWSNANHLAHGLFWVPYMRCLRAGKNVKLQALWFPDWNRIWNGCLLFSQQSRRRRTSPRCRTCRPCHRAWTRASSRLFLLRIGRIRKASGSCGESKLPNEFRLERLHGSTGFCTVM